MLVCSCFFFKQKTAYEMRISDWSSDVCSSDLPVVSGGRILTPAFADQAIADGRCDMVFVARSVIADPEWPNKCRDDQTSEIRACIGDLEGCFLRSCYGQPVGCTVNPDIGFEHAGPLTPAGNKKHVLVVGAGPRSEEHTYELQSLMRISSAVFCLQK